MIATPWLADRQPCIVAHRGWRDPAQAENSFWEMRKTWEAGRWMLEVDLSASQDGTIYLLHDDTVDRTTNGHGALAAFTDADVARLRLKDGSGRLTSEEVPRFDVVIEWMAATPGIRLMLDIKHIQPERVAAIVRAAGVVERMLILTFDRTTAAAAFAAEPDWLVSVFVTSEAVLAEYLSQFGSRAFAAYLPTFAPSELFRAVRAAGVIIVTDAIMPAPGGGLDARAAAGGTAIYRRYLAERPVDMLVTNFTSRIPTTTYGPTSPIPS